MEFPFEYSITKQRRPEALCLLDRAHMKAVDSAISERFSFDWNQRAIAFSPRARFGLPTYMAIPKTGCAPIK